MKQRLYTKTRTEFTGWPDKGYDELYTDYVGEALKDYETDMVLDIKRIMEIKRSDHFEHIERSR